MKAGSRFSVFRTARYLVGYIIFVAFLVSAFHSKVSHDGQSILVSQGMGIQLQIFSPAYAAFEDEFLFDEFDQMKSETLQAGNNDSYFVAHVDTPAPEFMSVTPLAFQVSLPPSVEDIEINPSKTRQIALQNGLKNKIQAAFGKPVVQAAPTKKETPPISVSIGPIVSFQQPSTQNPIFSTPVRKTRKPQPKQPDVGERKVAHKDIYQIAGNIELTGGIAFLGDLEVSWVVEDEEYSQGQISLKEGYYEIPVQHLTGDIIVSLYDENNRLVGEGIAHLDQLGSQEDFDPDHVDIEIKAIDTSLAGKVYDGEYINTSRPVQQAEVILFGINESSNTDDFGQYHFPNWRASGSRTIAMASKEGYKDSVYIIDASQTHEVFLFPNDYINALYKQLIQMGYNSDIQELGLVYGRIQEKGLALSDIEISIDGHDTAYFAPYYIPIEQQKRTSGNGLFTVAGLENGEHELLIERQGKVIDRRIVVVEAGKVSPIIIDLGLKSKKVKFFDPLRPQEKLDQTGYRFFDGEDYLLTKKDGRVDTNTTAGKDPALLEFAQSTGDENNIFINRAKRFEKVPIVNTKWFQEIKNQFKIDIKDGLAVGFVKSTEPFVISIVESPPDEILYFDKDGIIIKPSEDTPPSGFILVGLEQGLHTIVGESRSGTEIFFTDMVYNNHQSISVLYQDLL